MTRNLIIGILLSLALFGCVVKRERPADFNVDLTRENWMGLVANNPNRFIVGASRWFLTEDPNPTELASRKAPFKAAITTMMVNVPDFSKIKVGGDYQVQIFGTYGHNSVYVYGPNDGVRLASIDVQGDTLCINEQRNDPRHAGRVIIRIGINHLDSLLQVGGGSIEVIRIMSYGLDITQGADATGNIYLSGNVNLRSITKLGSGTISVFGANTPALEILTAGAGNVNVVGNVGIRSIIHHGDVEINIIGANSNSLTIDADGKGKISINGPVRIKEMHVKGATCVYAYPINTEKLFVYLCDQARVGLAGFARDLQVVANGLSRFEGRNLCSENAFVKAFDHSHINVSATSKAFASATQTASVYYFGPPTLLTKFTKDLGVIYPIWNDAQPSCPISYRPYNFQIEDNMPYRIERGPAPPRFKWKNKKLISYPGQG